MAIEPRFSEETEEVILNRMLDNLQNDVDKRQGSVAHDLLAPASIEFANSYIAMDQILKYAFITEEMPSDLLSLAAEDFGVSRKPASKAEGIVTFTGPENTFIPAGTQVRTDSLVYFETDVDVVISGGQFSAEVFAIEGGVSGNVGQFEVSTMVGPLAGIVEVINPFDFTGGVDEESDEALLERLRDKVRKPATSGNRYHYEQWAKEVPGVGDAKVEELWLGPGTVRVIILGADKKPPAQSVINDALTHIENERPIGADVTVVGASGVGISISADVVLVSGTDINAVVAAVSDGLSEYLSSIAFKENLVRYARISYIILDVPGVIDYDNLLINGGTSNIVINTNEVAVPGTVILDEA